MRLNKRKIKKGAIKAMLHRILHILENMNSGLDRLDKKLDTILEDK